MSYKVRKVVREESVASMTAQTEHRTTADKFNVDDNRVAPVFEVFGFPRNVRATSVHRLVRLVG